MAAEKDAEAEELVSNALTADEAEQYDRQIRLWGLDAQKRLRASCVLVVGLCGLGSEVSKNIVLAGVKEVTLMDHTPLEAGDSASRFLMQRDGVNRATQAVQRLRTLNPNVVIKADVEELKDKNDDFFLRFDVVVVTGHTTEELVRVNQLCRDNHIQYFCGDVWGYYGYFFTDLGDHEYSVEVQKQEKNDDVETVDGPKKKRAKLESSLVTVKETCSFCSFSEALSTDWSQKPAKYFRRTPPTYFIIHSLQLFRDREGRNPTTSASDKETLDQLRGELMSKFQLGAELFPADYSQWCLSGLSPVCAVVGGVLAQEVIKAISANDHPYQNTFLYNGQQNTGIIELLHP